jgi:hypothetical protein
MGLHQPARVCSGCLRVSYHLVDGVQLPTWAPTVDFGQLMTGWGNLLPWMPGFHAVLMGQRTAEGLLDLMASLSVAASPRSVTVGLDAHQRYQVRCGLQLEIVVLIGEAFAGNRKVDGYDEGKPVDLRSRVVGAHHAPKPVLEIGSLDWGCDLCHDP